MKDEYVKFGTAQILKEKGFDWECDWYYPKNGGEIEMLDLYELNYCRESFISAPTQQMACDWLTEEKNIYITAVPDIGNSLRFYPAIYVIKGEIPEECWFEYINSVVAELNKSYDKPQQAIEVALQYCLTNLI